LIVRHDQVELRIENGSVGAAEGDGTLTIVKENSPKAGRPTPTTTNPTPTAIPRFEPGTTWMVLH
jgi:hypothetical protein